MRPRRSPGWPCRGRAGCSRWRCRRSRRRPSRFSASPAFCPQPHWSIGSRKDNALTFSLPANVAPASPVTYEWLQVLMESQAQETAALASAGAAASGYLGWTVPVGQATSTASLTTTDIYVVAVYVPAAGTATYAEVNATTAGTVTAANTGLYSLTGAKLASAGTGPLTTHTGAG